MKSFDEEREFDTWCRSILDYTRERAENDSEATRWIFDRLTHDEWTLARFPKHLASVSAYEQFYSLTGQDIRKFNWNDYATTKSGDRVLVRKLFFDEHLTTAHDFKYEILDLYGRGKLTLEKIKELVLQQRLCWITKEENRALSKNGFGTHRDDPLQAYASCGIKIYDAENEDLRIMKPTFDEKGRTDMVDFYQKLKEYFDSNLVGGRKYAFSYDAEKSHAKIYARREFMINLRYKKGALKDICLYIDGDKAKQDFARLLLKKEEIESRLGYTLVWNKNEGGKSVRIGRFFAGAKLTTSFEIANQDKCFDFNIDDEAVEKVATELAKFYDVFVPILEELK